MSALQEVGKIGTERFAQPPSRPFLLLLSPLQPPRPPSFLGSQVLSFSFFSPSLQSMTLRSNNRLRWGVGFFFLVLVYALWTSPPSFSPSSWTSSGAELQLDEGFDVPSFKDTLLGEGGFDGDDGVGQGAKEEGGNVELEHDEADEPEGEFRISSYFPLVVSLRFHLL